jgi:hypothetical protein
MQKINIHNYEAFLLDYLEGNLNERDLQELKNFALINPELDIDLSADALPVFTSEKNVFENKFQLKKNEDDFILNNPALNYIENTLSTSEKINFENELKAKSDLQKEVTQFQKTKLSAEALVIYPNIEELKKETKVIALFNFRTVSSIAAGLLLLISLSVIFYFNSNEKSEGKIALQLKNKINYSVHKIQSTDSVITNSVLNNSSNNLIAKKGSHIEHSRRESNTTNSINPINNIKNIVTNNPLKKDSIGSTNSSINNFVAISTNSSNPLTFTNTITSVTSQTTLLAFEEDSDETTQAVAPQKNNFWKRAVKVAKQLNGLGLKAVKGDEKSNSNYVLAFNSVSIEKK